MDKIIALSRTHSEELTDIDYASNHQCSVARHVSRAEMRKEIIARFKGIEQWFGYQKGKVLAGYATMKPFFPGHKHCELSWLAVRSEFQGQGIGSKLISHIERYARTKGFRAIYVYTHKEMAMTRKFYEKNGYVFVNEFPNFYGYKKMSTTAVLYTKNLAK